jgi:hypothetical protein
MNMDSIVFTFDWETANWLLLDSRKQRKRRNGTEIRLFIYLIMDDNHKTYIF